uniref:DUF1604 domain-containing protein n=1 Tax=Rhabditophanes sp. KR3021 TaxID=114890 RepID=A0AC35TTL3_9BILA
MAYYRESSPIAGFTGHIPGAKFHIGGGLNRKGFADGKPMGYHPKVVGSEEQGQQINLHKYESVIGVEELERDMDRSTIGTRRNSVHGMYSQYKLKFEHGLINEMHHSRKDTAEHSRKSTADNSRDEKDRSVNTRAKFVDSRVSTSKSRIATGKLDNSRLSTLKSAHSIASTEKSFNSRPPTTKSNKNIINFDDYSSQLPTPPSITSNKSHFHNKQRSNSIAPSRPHTVGRERIKEERTKLTASGIWDKKPIPYVETKAAIITRKSTAKSDLFNGAEAGWWSESEALRNTKHIRKKSLDNRDGIHYEGSLNGSVRVVNGYTGHIHGHQSQKVGKTISKE